MQPSLVPLATRKQTCTESSQYPGFVKPVQHPAGFIEGLRSFLLGLVDSKEVLVSEGVDGLASVEVCRHCPKGLSLKACRHDD